MGDVSDVVTSRIDWKRLRYNRNNSSYLMLINVCFMAPNRLILTTRKEAFNTAKHLIQAV